MKRLLLPLLIASFVFASTAQCSAASVDEAVAARFWPEDEYRAFEQDHKGRELTRSWKVTRGDIDPATPGNELAVAYSNGSIGMLRVIDAEGAALLASSDIDLSPRITRLTATDLQQDGSDEILVHFSEGNTSVEHLLVFGWSKPVLVCLNPVEDGVEETFREPAIVDIDGDGRSEVVEEELGLRTDVTTAASSAAGDVHDVRIYRLVEGRYQRTTQSVPYYNAFRRSAGAPRMVRDEFHASPGRYEIRLINGDNGRNEADSASVMLNGAPLFGPADFKKRQPILRKMVDAAATNTIGVELRGKPGSTARIVLLAETPAQ